MQFRLRDIFHYFLRLGCLGFGGPVALISLLLVVRWKVSGLLLVAGAGIVGLLAYHS